MLENIRPYKVMQYFEKLCAIPHGSGNVKAISDYCVNFAKERGLFVRQDEMHNVVIVKEASEGYEQAPAVILQGHLDMVCEKNSDVEFDFEHQGLNLAVEGDFVYAAGTTLGGDDGIAVACILAILDDGTIKHPRLEAVMTTDEEVGMEGASFIDVSDLKGRMLINIDSEEEGKILTSCAGGMRSDLSFHVKHLKMTGNAVEIRIKGLKGGHSGADIHKLKGNANVILGRILFELYKACEFGVSYIEGGMKDNAIPREAYASLCIPQEAMETFEAAFKKTAGDLKNELKTSEPELSIEKSCGAKGVYTVFDMASMQKLLFVWFNAPNGIQTMSADLPGLVESSLNLGVIRTEKDSVTLRYALRSSVKSLKWHISDKLQYMTEMMGGVYTYEGDYPEWEFKKDSPLRTLACDIYEEMYGSRPALEAIHAGLECGLFSEKIPDLDMISIGPDIQAIHTPDEKLSISSTERVYNWIVRLLEQINK